MEKDIKTRQKKIVKRSYLARDFDDFKSNLIRHARTFFPENIEDFTETGIGGMFVDMISYIGDSMSYYLDHQFNELSWRDSIEVENLLKHLELSGVKSYGASPAVGYVTIYIRVPINSSNTTPDTGKEVAGDCLPIIKAGTRFVSNNGINFNLIEDVDFNERDVKTGKYLWANNRHDDFESDTGVAGTFGYKNIQRKGFCVSGQIREENFAISDSFVPFREVTLAEQNISLIESIYDSDGNRYYEVDNLSQDNVFSITDNKRVSSNAVEKSISLIGAPYRYTKEFDPQTFITTLTFGGGDAQALDDDILPDPGDLSLPLYGRKTFSRFALDPNSLMRTNTLGVAPRNVSITVKYRHGGGFVHNVSASSIRQIEFLDITFPINSSFKESIFVRTNIAVDNNEKFIGGSPAPTLEELRDQIPIARNSQMRVVTKEDLLARIYSLPSGLGRVFRASISEAPNGLGQVEIALISRDVNGNLVKNYNGTRSGNDNPLMTASDNLKINLKNYLESFRLLNDAYIIVDAKVHNISVDVRVIGVPGYQKSLIAQNIISNIKSILDIRKFQINQPIAMGDLNFAVLSSEGVSSVVSDNNHPGVLIESRSGIKTSGDGIDEYDYSLSSAIIISEYLERGFLFPHKNGIFELKYPDNDIRVTVL